MDPGAPLTRSPLSSLWPPPFSLLSLSYPKAIALNSQGQTTAAGPLV